VTEYVWRGLEVDGLERARVTESTEVEIESIVDSARGRYSYELELGPDWTFRSLRLEALAGQRTLLIARDASGVWSVDGVERGEFVDAVDIDLAITPLTNSLPIRRLDLDVDDEADLDVVYVSFPDLEVTLDPQRYTRLDEDLYLFESLDGDFSAEITVDARGMVTEYPELFERL
jgi:hypothetical protein